MNASLRGADTMRSRYSKEKTATTTISPIRNTGVTQAGNPDRVSKPTETRLITINARMRFSKACAYGPSRSSSRCANCRTGALTDSAARPTNDMFIGARDYRICEARYLL